MQLRRFTADTTPDAMLAVRRELGEDALILANRKVGDQVEIIATLGMDAERATVELDLARIEDHHDHRQGGAQKKQRSTANLLAAGMETGVLEAKPDTPSTPAASDALALEQLHARHLAQQVSARAAPANDSHLSAEHSARREKIKPPGNSEHVSAGSDRTSRVQKRSTKPVQRAVTSSAVEPLKYANSRADKAEHSNAGDSVSQAIQDQNALIEKHFKALEVNLWGNSSPGRRQHLQQLLKLGIGAELAVRLAERCDQSLGVDEALRHSFAVLKATLPVATDKTLSNPGVTVVSGAPGAGKTTALMKLATQHVRENGSDSIVIICADTRRIGAFEELQAYGRLLGVPTVHAHDSGELDSLLNAFTHKRLVLIDHTLPMDDDAVELPRRLREHGSLDTVRQLFVLSATDQAATTDALLHKHCDTRLMHCVFTHLDATARLGELLSSVIRHNVPIAYWSDSASVQKPLQKADASVLIASAVAMSRRMTSSADDEWLMRLIQPSSAMLETTSRSKRNPKAGL